MIGSQMMVMRVLMIPSINPAVTLIGPAEAGHYVYSSIPGRPAGGSHGSLSPKFEAMLNSPRYGQMTWS